MGAFFLQRLESPPNSQEAREIFRRKGFGEPKTFELGHWRLYLYRKIVLDVENFVTRENCFLCCIGTVVYRGKGYRDSLVTLLRDFQAGQVCQEELIGHFCVLFWDGERLTALTDHLNTLHVFVNEERTCFSSSFLALLASSPNPLSLNRLGVCEKLATGYIVSPDTLVEGIWQINDKLAQSFYNDRDKIRFLPHLKRPDIRLHSEGKKESLGRQIEVLGSHFASIDRLHCEFSGELGLSDGFDSRLVLACGKFFSKSLALHTHATRGVHDGSRRIVEEIARNAGLELSCVATRRLEELDPERLGELLDDGLYYFDARCSHNMGAMSETYTGDYKRRVLGEHRLSLNGIGGEIFRNYYETRRHGRRALRSWMEHHVYYTFAQEALGNAEIFKEMDINKQRKIADRLCMTYSSTFDFLWSRRYYSEVRMPDCDANNCDAQNQMAFYHMPFVQPKIIWEGIDATPYIGLAGTYQGALIRELAPKIARLPSHYGYQLDGEMPKKERMISHLRELIPDGVLVGRMKRRLKAKSEGVIQEVKGLTASEPLLAEGLEALRASGILSDPEIALRHYAQRPTVLYIGRFLAAFADKLRW